MDNNLENIKNFHNGLLIKEAESKLLFIAFCFEFNRYLKIFESVKSTLMNPNDNIKYQQKTDGGGISPKFITYLPIQLDATCNGFQHISMLALDQELISKVNIKNATADDSPEDFYTIISNLIKGYLDKKLKENNRDSLANYASYERLYNINIQRTIIKKSIMTMPYNVSAIQSIKYLKDSFIEDLDYTNLQNNKDNKTTKGKWFRHIKDENLYLKDEDFVVLYKVLSKVLENTTSIKLITDYLWGLADICSQANIPIPWRLPTGLIINQSYMQSKEIRIAPFDYIKHTFQVKVPVKEKLDLLKQNRAFMPNLIHSLDATTLVFLIEAYFNKNPNPVTNFYAIHDCFGTTCNNMQYIISMLQSIYISLYSDKKYLLEIDNYMRYYVKDKIDNNFDIKSVGGKVEISTVNRKNEEKIIKRTFPNINNIINNKFDLSTYLKNSFYIIN